MGGSNEGQDPPAHVHSLISDFGVLTESMTIVGISADSKSPDQTVCTRRLIFMPLLFAYGLRALFTHYQLVWLV